MERATLAGADSVLARTPEGTRKMRLRSPDLTPKLRSVLFLVSGELTFGELLERAGALRSVLESQIHALLELGLVEAAGSRGPAVTSDHTTPVETSGLERPSDLPPLVAAKIQILLRLEGTACDAAELLGADLLEARTLLELAERARAAAMRVRESVGATTGDRFWAQCKEILVAWRDFAPGRSAAQ
jgi:hypothetical protein